MKRTVCLILALLMLAGLCTSCKNITSLLMSKLNGKEPAGTAAPAYSDESNYGKTSRREYESTYDPYTEQSAEPSETETPEDTDTVVVTPTPEETTTPTLTPTGEETVTPTPDGQKSIIVLAIDVKIRKGPGSSYGMYRFSVIGDIYSCVSEEYDEKGELWYLVEFANGKNGYMTSKYCDVYDPAKRAEYDKIIYQKYYEHFDDRVIGKTAVGTWCSVDVKPAHDGLPPMLCASIIKFSYNTASKEHSVSVSDSESYRAYRVAGLSSAQIDRIYDYHQANVDRGSEYLERVGDWLYVRWDGRSENGLSGTYTYDFDCTTYEIASIICTLYDNEGDLHRRTWKYDTRHIYVTEERTQYDYEKIDNDNMSTIYDLAVSRGLI